MVNDHLSPIDTTYLPNSGFGSVFVVGPLNAKPGSSNSLLEPPGYLSTDSKTCKVLMDPDVSQSRNGATHRTFLGVIPASTEYVALAYNHR